MTLQLALLFMISVIFCYYIIFYHLCHGNSVCQHNYKFEQQSARYDNRVLIFVIFNALMNEKLQYRL